MELQVKQRITGAIVLVVLVVIFVPALLSGPRHPSAGPPAEAGQAPLQSYRSELKAGSAAPIPPGVEPAPPETPRANADDTVAAVTAGDGAATERDAAHEPDETPTHPQRRTAPTPVESPPAAKSAPARAPPPTKPVAASPQKPAAAPAPKAVAAPLPKPVAAPPAKPAAAAPGDWAVQLGGFSSRANAQKLVTELKGQGFSAYVADGSSPGHPLFRVRSGPVRDRAAADALLKRLKAKGHSGSVVTNP